MSAATHHGVHLLNLWLGPPKGLCPEPSLLCSAGRCAASGRATSIAQDPRAQLPNASMDWGGIFLLEGGGGGMPVRRGQTPIYNGVPEKLILIGVIQGRTACTRMVQMSHMELRVLSGCTTDVRAQPCLNQGRKWVRCV